MSMVNKKVEPDLYQCSLPGGFTAKFYRTAELTPRRSRELSVYTSYLMPILRQLQRAQTVTVGGKVADKSDVLDGIPVGLSLDETRQMFEMNDIAAWTYLKSWTVRTQVRDDEGQIVERLLRPLPETVDELRDLPGDLYDALTQHAGKIMNAVEPDFTVQSVADEDSPTGL
jgi:hypothetical protein